MNIRTLSKIAKKLSIGKTRNFPLSESGLIVTVTVGVAGLSPQQAEQEMAQIIEDYRDDGEISKHFKFYKEYYLADADSNENRMEVTII